MTFREPSRWLWWPEAAHMEADDILSKARESFPHFVVLEEVGTREITAQVVRDFLEDLIEGEWTLLFHHRRDYAPSDIYLFFTEANDAVHAKLVLS